jgi:hypothetical protein
MIGSIDQHGTNTVPPSNRQGKCAEPGSFPEPGRLAICIRRGQKSVSKASIGADLLRTVGNRLLQVAGTAFFSAEYRQPKGSEIDRCTSLIVSLNEMLYSSNRAANTIDHPAKEQMTGCPNPVSSQQVDLSFSPDSQGAVPTMKRSFTAAFLSAVLPGAGLWYLGRRGPAICNFLVALSVPLICLTAGFLSEHILWIFLAIAAGSAGLAHSQA